MRKIPAYLDNPLDNLFVDIGDTLSPFFKKLNMTPNQLTSISIIASLYSIYLYIKKDYSTSAIIYIISYLFDCFDGHYARKYNMTSKFGDYYDHISDILTGVIFYVIILYKYLRSDSVNQLIPLIGLIFTVTMNIHLACQDKYYELERGKKETGKSLDIFKFSCPASKKGDLIKIMRVSRFFSSGTHALFMVFLILYSKRIDKML